MEVWRGSQHTGKGKFYSTDRDFASDYGTVEKYILSSSKILDTTSLSFAENYVFPNDMIDPYSGVIITRDNWKAIQNDTWEFVESNLEYFPIYEYDAILITEGGIENYLVLNPRVITKMFSESVMDNDLLTRLKTEYHRFNNMLYERQLPDIPFAWGSPKRSLAAVMFRVMKHDRSLAPNTMRMVFSDHYKLPWDRLIGILLHEMIHVYLIAVLGDTQDNHGLAFKKELARLRVKTRIDIPITESTKDLEIQSDVQEVGVCVRTLYDGRHAFALFSPKTIRERSAEFEGKWRDEYELRIVKSELWYRKSLNSPLQRNINYKTKFFMMSDADYHDLRENSVIVQ